MLRVNKALKIRMPLAVFWPRAWTLVDSWHDLLQASMLSRMVIVAVALGSNLGKRQAALRSAADRLRDMPASTLLALATFRQTLPVDAPQGSPAFLNSAVTLETQLPPEQLLSSLLEIERSLGRIRDDTTRNAPRTIDLDLLLHGNTTLDSPFLTLPHPRMHQRLFVLEPLAEIAPDLVHPTLHKTVRQLLEDLRTAHGNEPLKNETA